MKIETEKQPPTRLMKAAPWMAGAGIAVGHILTSSNCTLPKQGLCSTCGSCVVALGSLVAWAMIKKRQGNDFYSQKEIS